MAILHYHDLAKRIEAKYSIKLRGYKDKKHIFDDSYLDFWHWVIEMNPQLVEPSSNAGNGCYISIPLIFNIMPSENPDLIEKIKANLIKAKLKPEEMDRCIAEMERQEQVRTGGWQQEILDLLAVEFKEYIVDNSITCYHS